MLTLSLNGQTTALVRDDSTGTWRLQADDGAVVTEVTGSGNGTGTYDTSYWKITERDGTAYYFGLNHLPGFSPRSPRTSRTSPSPARCIPAGSTTPGNRNPCWKPLPPTPPAGR